MVGRAPKTAILLCHHLMCSLAFKARQRALCHFTDPLQGPVRMHMACLLGLAVHSTQLGQKESFVGTCRNALLMNSLFFHQRSLLQHDACPFAEVAVHPAPALLLCSYAMTTCQVLTRQGKTLHSCLFPQVPLCHQSAQYSAPTSNRAPDLKAVTLTHLHHHACHPQTKIHITCVQLPAAPRRSELQFADEPSLFMRSWVSCKTSSVCFGQFDALGKFLVSMFLSLLHRQL